MIGRVNTGGGGSSTGFAVTVRHCGANATVTARKGGKSEFVVANADGIAIFDKLAKGVWTFSSNKFSSLKIAEISSATTTSLLPSGYKEVEYLKSSGTQYINTELVANSAYTYKIRFKLNAEEDVGIFGSRVAYQNTMHHIDTPLNAIAYGYGEKAEGVIRPETEWFEVETLGQTWKINGVSQPNITGSFTTGLVDYLFAMNQNGSAFAPGYMNISEYYVMSDNNYLVYMIPCVNSENVGGVYDLARNKFYTNNGTGTFAVGDFVGTQSANGMIIYTAPAGKTVTATKGSTVFNDNKTLIGDEEIHVFIIKPDDFGTIAVTCDGNEHTVEVNSNITVEMSYILYLYKNGDEFGLGGVPEQIYKDTSKGVSVTLNDTYISIDLMGNKDNRAGFPNAVDFSAYSTMKAIVKAPSKWTTATQFQFGVDSEQLTSAAYTAQALNNYAASTEYTIPLDISSYNEVSKPWFALYNGTGISEENTLHVLEIFLE